jgi:hypothetical protein
MYPSIRKPQTLVLTVLLILALLASVQIFFEIYREAAFNTLPRDDYASFLLYLVGQGGSFPGSPYAYRVLSVLAAIPFFYTLPLYRFSNLGAVDPLYLRATEALAMVSYLSILLTALIVYLIARKRLAASSLAALLAALVVPLLSYSISRPGIDPLAVLWVALLVYLYPRPGWFAALVLVSAFVNEKIPFIFAVVMLARWIWLRGVKRQPISRTLWVEGAASLLALAVYFIARAILKYPGFENQADLRQFAPQILASLTYIFSLKGLVLNLLPIAILFILAGLAVWGKEPRLDGQFFPSDGLCALALLILALGTDLQFTIGRVVMFAYPLYLPVAARLLDSHLARTA